MSVLRVSDPLSDQARAKEKRRVAEGHEPIARLYASGYLHGFIHPVRLRRSQPAERSEITRALHRAHEAGMGRVGVFFARLIVDQSTAVAGRSEAGVQARLPACL